MNWGTHRQDAGMAAHPGFENCEDESHFECPDCGSPDRSERGTYWQGTYPSHRCEDAWHTQSPRSTSPQPKDLA